MADVNNPERKVYAVILKCIGPVEVFVSRDGSIHTEEDSYSCLRDTTLNGGSVLTFHDFSGIIGIPPATPFFIESAEEGISGAFAAPGCIIGEGPVVAVVDSRLGIAATTDRGLYLDGEDLELVDIDLGSCFTSITEPFLSLHKSGFLLAEGVQSNFNLVRLLFSLCNPC